MEFVYGPIEYVSAKRIVRIMNTAASTNVSLLRLIKSRRNRQIGRVAILLLHMSHSLMCLFRFISWYNYIWVNSFRYSVKLNSTALSVVPGPMSNWIRQVILQCSMFVFPKLLISWDCFRTLERLEFIWEITFD